MYLTVDVAGKKCEWKVDFKNQKFYNCPTIAHDMKITWESTPTCLVYKGKFKDTGIFFTLKVRASDEITPATAEQGIKHIIALYIGAVENDKELFKMYYVR